MGSPRSAKTAPPPLPTAIQHAAREGNLPALKAWLAVPTTDPNARDAHGNTVLILAVHGLIRCSPDEVLARTESLASSLMATVPLNACNQWGATALDAAAREGLAPVIQALLPFSSSREQKKAFQHALENAQPAAVKALLPGRSRSEVDRAMLHVVQSSTSLTPLSRIVSTLRVLLAAPHSLAAQANVLAYIAPLGFREAVEVMAEGLPVSSVREVYASLMESDKLSRFELADRLAHALPLEDLQAIPAAHLSDMPRAQTRLLTTLLEEGLPPPSPVRRRARI